jgi:hypothetical protein
MLQVISAHLISLDLILMVYLDVGGGSDDRVLDLVAPMPYSQRHARRPRRAYVTMD